MLKTAVGVPTTAVAAVGVPAIQLGKLTSSVRFTMLKTAVGVPTTAVGERTTTVGVLITACAPTTAVGALTGTSSRGMY